MEPVSRYSWEKLFILEAIKKEKTTIGEGMRPFLQTSIEHPTKLLFYPQTI